MATERGEETLFFRSVAAGKWPMIWWTVSHEGMKVGLTELSGSLKKKDIKWEGVEGHRICEEGLNRKGNMVENVIKIH